MQNTERELKLLSFFREKEANKENFKTNEASSYSGYPRTTINKYISEKLRGKYIYKGDKRTWYSKGISSLSDDDFLRIMSQSTKSEKLTEEEKMFKSLTHRSLDAFTLALESYNRPSLSNRVEAFSILMVNAWELLLKAEILKTHKINDLYYDNGNSLSITDAVNKVYSFETDKKENLKVLIELRDHATHLLIPELQPKLSEVFQANVINYTDKYKELLGNSPLAGQSVGMLSLIIDGIKPEVAVIKETYGLHTANEVKKFLDKIETLESKHISSDFSVTVKYELVLTKNKSKSDIILSPGPTGEMTKIITKAKALNKSHPYFRDCAIKEINRRMGSILLNQYSFQAIIMKNNVRNKPELHDFTDRRRFSQKFIDWAVSNLRNEKWLKSCVDFRKNNDSISRDKTA
tara:strand:- start:3643 stop:4860 length:1218 start_codon:yes stop_codon:yes gene_type:complete